MKYFQLFESFIYESADKLVKKIQEFAATRKKGAEKIAGGGKLRHLALQLVQADPIPRGRHLPVLGPDDLLEDVARFRVGMGNRVFQMGHLHRWIGGAAADLQ